MFKELRNKFLMLNLLIITILMIIAFSSIFLITYKNTRSDIDNELQRLSERNDKVPPYGNPSTPPFQKNLDNQNPPEMSVSFNILSDRNKQNFVVHSIFDMEDSFYEKAKNIAFSSNNLSGTFNSDGTQWAYKVKQLPSHYSIVFLDVSNHYRFLTNLIYNFIIVAIIMIICIFFISRFFANKSIKPIQEAFEKQKQFIADASHELKTPLAVINTNLDVLLNNVEEIHSSKWLTYIKSETERMSKLTNDLLYLAQVDDFETKKIFAEFNISEIAEDIALTMEAVIFEKSITLSYEIAPNLIAFGNSEQIRQVIMILIDNAIKYTNKDGKIDMKLTSSNNSIVFIISNTGEGIAKEHLHRLFDHFYRVDTSRTSKNGGYGLGLSIARSIIEQHKGTLSVKSNIGQNTTFVMELPFSHINFK